MTLCCAVQEKNILDDFSAFLAFSIFYLEVGVGVVTVSLDFDSVLSLARVLNIFPPPLGGWVGVSTPCGAVSTRGISVFVPPLSELYMHMKGFPRQRWGSILPRLRWLYVQAPINQQLASGVGVSTPCGAVSIWENIVFVHGALEL